jgi:hypothetical protein
MKYIKRIKDYDKNLVNNVNLHKTYVSEVCRLKLPDPEYGDLKLSVFPFENNIKWVSLPESFKIWEDAFNKVCKMIPMQEGANQHYITIDTKFFTNDEFLRREGVHVDGNFCVDPNFKSIKEFKESPFKASWGGAEPSETKPTWGGAEPAPKPSWGGATYRYNKTEKEDGEFKASWGGAEPSETKPSWGGAEPSETKPSWGGATAKEYVYEAKEDNSHVKMDWVLPYKLTIPVGDYISENKGGILTVSTEIGCQAWNGEFVGEILSEGAFTEMEDQLSDDRKIIFEKNKLYFMSSNTPHETLLITKGKRRTFMRITLNHNYDNKSFR